MLVATPTLADPSRAPEGHHTVKLLAPQSSASRSGASRHAERQRTAYDAVRPELHSATSMLDRLVKMPEDIERQNEHMIGGTFHGGDRTLPQSGALRPVPGWAQHRMPIPGLYQTGGTTHPGGSITGGPGRNAAIGRCSQTWDTTSRRWCRGAGRPRAGRD